MNKIRILAAFVGGMAALGLAGCGSDSSLSPASSASSTSLITVDESTLATVAAEGAADAVGQMNGHGAPKGLLPRLPGNVPSGCAYDAATGRFLCPDQNMDDGLTVDRSYAFLDGAGNPQSAYDATSTAAINFLSHVYGTKSGGRGSVTLDHQRTLMASGLEGAETTWTWNGSGSGEEHRVGPPPRRGGPGGGPAGGRGHGPGGRPDSTGGAPADTVVVDITHSMSVSNVVVPMPRTPAGWPLSGSISQTITATVTGGPQDGETRTRTITITFNGTQNASLNDGASTVTIDLANPGRPPQQGGRR